VAIQLAKWLDAEIISCDSRQFFKELKIGAAPPSDNELAEVKHHFIKHLNVTDIYNAGMFERDALNKLDELFTKNDVAVMVGGSGLYANAVLHGFDDLPTADSKIRSDLNAIFEKKGIGILQEELMQKDPTYFNQVDKENAHRLIRALEVIRQTGKPYSQLRSAQKAERNFESITIVMDVPRPVLYERINHRVDGMIANGLVAEASSLRDYQDLQTLNTVGYKELFAHFNGETSLEEAVNLIKQNTRRFAKRQVTWLKRDKEAFLVHPEKLNEMKNIISNKLKELNKAAV
jgi:tRNA dimethylallyltransferase